LDVKEEIERRSDALRLTMKGVERATNLEPGF
jgi:hypothetical protein